MSGVRGIKPVSRAGLWTSAALLLIALLVISAMTGPVQIAPGEALAIVGRSLGLQFGGIDDGNALVFTGLRLPRVILAAFVGAAFAVSGALLQGMFRNPLASPTLIGTMHGSMLGAVGFIVLGGAAGVPQIIRELGLPVAAFLGGSGATFLVFRMASREGRTSVGTMLLAGIAVNALVLALTGFLMTIADDAQLRSITFWNLGGLGGNGWREVYSAGILITLVLLVVGTLARPLNAMLLGEREALHLGVPVKRVTLLCVLLPALAVGVSVSVAGNIQFVGLVVPNLVRIALGPDHRLVLPGAALFGAMLMVVADAVSRVLIAPAELPVGILTAAIGAPFFLFLLMRDRRTAAF